MSSAIWQILAGQQKRELFEKNGRKSVAILGQKKWGKILMINVMLAIRDRVGSSKICWLVFD